MPGTILQGSWLIKCDSSVCRGERTLHRAVSLILSSIYNINSNISSDVLNLLLGGKCFAGASAFLPHTSQ